VGFPDISDNRINDLIKKHQVKLAVVNRFGNALEPDEKLPLLPPNVYFKNYVTFIDLPPTKEEYLNQLGKNKQKQLPQYLRRANRFFSSDIEIRYELGNEIKIEEIVELEKLNSKRRAGRGKGIDALQEIRKRQENRWALTKASGLLMTFRHQDKILGGNLTFLHGKEAILNITAHDNTLDNLRIGLLGMWKTMEYLMDNGYQKCCFLWGRNAYKTQFLGIEFPWNIHVISPYKSLAIAWKYQIMLNEFYIRGLRFLKTRLRLN
jgi:Acetyltransferase (GNAT) domain